jgi:DNA repair exonuclease SbcCD ATPase subunit
MSDVWGALDDVQAKNERLERENAELRAIMDRHKIREQYVSDMVYQYIKHGDEKHQEWLRVKLNEVLTVEGAAQSTFDDLQRANKIQVDQIAELEDELECLKRELASTQTRNVILEETNKFWHERIAKLEKVVKHSVCCLCQECCDVCDTLHPKPADPGDPKP